MVRYYTSIKTSLFLLFLAFFLQGFSQTFNKNYVDGRVFFKLKNNVPLAIDVKTKDVNLGKFSKLSEIFSKYSVGKVEVLSKKSDEKLLARTFRIYFPNFSQVDLLIKALEQLDIVEYAEREPLYYVDWAPDDPYYKNNINNKGDYRWKWYFDLINAEDAWQVSQDQIGKVGSSDIKVAVVDNAILTTHEDLDVYLQHDAADDDDNASPPIESWDWSHGTHCSGLATAKTNNGIGIPSLGGNVQLIAVKCTKDNTDNPESLGYTYDGVKWAMDNGADIISMSFGGSGYSQTFQNLMNSAYDKGIVLLAAAGNDNVSDKNYPAAYDHVIAVGSVDSDDGKSSFSNWNDPSASDDWVDIAGPGGFQVTTNVGLLSSVDTADKESDYGPDGYYGLMSGTSMSTPVVAGVAGLMLSVYPDLTVDQVEGCLISTAAQIADKDSVGPRVDAKAAMDCAVDKMKSPPKANFVADHTTVNIGSTAQFTDKSAPKATSWEWTFYGGDTLNSTEQNPSVKYDTIGDYDVKLKATNDYGSGDTTKTLYIHVKDPSYDCDTINHWEGDVAVYTPSGTDGYVAGTNGYGDLAKADYYTQEEVAGYSYIKEVKLLFVGYGYTTHGGTNDSVSIVLWDSEFNIIGTENVAYDDIMTDVNNNDTTIVTFNPPVTIPGDFLAGFEIPDPSDGDTLVIFTNRIGQTSIGGTDYEQLDNGDWYAMSDRWIGFDSTSLAMAVTVCPGKPYADFSVDENHICEGYSVSFTDESHNTQATEWEWIFEGGDPDTSIEQNPVVRYDNVGTYKVTLIAKNSFGNDTLIRDNFITVDLAPYGGAVSATETEICSGETTSLKVEGSRGSIQWQVSSDSSSWSDVSGATSTTYTTPALTSDKYYRVKATGGTTCPEEYSNVVHIVVNPSPVVTANADPGTSLCEGDELTLTGGGADSYSWDHGVTDSVAFTPSVGTVKYTVTGTSSGCSSTASITVTVNALSIDAESVSASSTEICDGESTTLTYQGGSGNTFNWYTSSCGGTLVGSGNNLGVSPTATTTYYGRWENDCGNSSCQSVTVTVDEVPTLTMSSNDATCGNNDGSATVDASGNASTYTYLWDDDAAQDSATAINLGLGTYNVTVTSGACIATGSVNVNEEGAPDVSVSASDTVICEGETTVLTATGADTYSWTPATGLDATTGDVVNASPSEDITYTVTGTAAGCSASASISVTVNSLPTAANSVSASSTNICNGESTTLTYQGGNGVTFNWYTSSCGGSLVGSGNNLSVSPTVTTTYYGRWENDCGNSSCQSVTVTVDEVPTLTMSSNDATCGNNDGSATVDASGNASTYTYLWDDDAAQDSATAINLGLGTYNVTVTSGACIATGSVNVNEEGAPDVSVSASDTVICEGETTVLTATGADTYSWTPATGLDATTGDVVNASPSEDITYTVTGTAAGCSAFDNITITVNHAPNAGFTIDDSGKPIIVFTNTTTGADSYYWDLGDGTTETTTNVSHEYTTNNTFTVVLSATNGCGTDTTQQEVVITGINISSLDKESIKIYPNPTETTINIYLPINNVTIQLVSMDGKILKTVESKDSKYVKINVKNLAAGIYNLIVTTEHNEQVIIKVVKK